MSINTQKKIMFIPILNILPLIFFIKLKSKQKSKTIFIKQFIKMAALIFLITITRVGIIAISPAVGQSGWTTAVCIYLYFFVMSCFSVLGQIDVAKAIEEK